MLYATKIEYAAEVLRQIGTIGMSPARSLRPSSEATSGASGAQ
jgi:hypothetical protein